MHGSHQIVDLPNRTKVPVKRVLGLTTSILLVAGNMIGSGVFKKIAPMAALGLDKDFVLGAWIVAGFFTIFGAFTIAGLTNLTSESGGKYEYLRIMFGPFLSFLFGWTGFMILGSGSVAALAFIFSQSVNSLIPLHDPMHALHDISIGGFLFPFASSGIKILAIAAIIILTWINYRGTKKAASLNNILTAVKVSGILFLIALGLFFAGDASDPAVGVAGKLETGTLYSAFFAALLSAFWAYDGWANLPYVAGEIKNPARNVPLAIIAGVMLVMTLYLLTNFAYMRVMSLNELAAVGQNQIAAAAVAARIIGNAGVVFIAILIMISTLGALNTLILFYSRLFYRMAIEKSFFKRAAKIHPVFGTPYFALLYVMIWSCLLVVTGTFDLLTDLVIFASFFFYMLLSWGLIKMKRNRTITARVIGYPFVPIVVILFSLALLINTIYIQPKQTLLGIGLMFSGLPFYYFFRKRQI